jgi:lysophospholipase L1-like esterase
MPTVVIAGTGTTTVSGAGETRAVRYQPWLFAIGDSKTAGDEWKEYLRVTPTPPSWLVVDGGVVGRTVATTADNIAAMVTTNAGITEAPLALVNLGVNEMGALPSQGTWVADYLEIIDALAAQWPTVRVYLMRPWRQGFDTDSDTLASWITGIVASRPAIAALGPDERVWLKGADNGATNTLDGIHYSAAGEVAAAAAWAAVLWP